MGLRYVRARSHEFFVSFITWASLIGVCVGVAALIVILSVMNGFESELRDRLLSLSAQVRVTEAAQPGAAAATHCCAVAKRGRHDRSQPRGHRCHPLRRAAGARRAPAGNGAGAPARHRSGRRLDPQRAGQGHRPGSPGRSDRRLDRVIVGAIIAERLGLSIGDPLTVLIPTVTADGAPAPKLREFTVAGVFEVGLQDHDGTLVFANLDDVQALGAEGSATPRACGCACATCWQHPRWPRSCVALLPPDLEVTRLDPGQRQLLPRDPHREDDDVAHPAADRGGRRLQHRGDAGHGGDRQAHRHRHRAHLRGRAAPGHGRSSSPRAW